MKRIKISNLWAAAIMCVVTLFVSCSKDDVSTTAPQPTTDPQPTTYTVMLYGCGGRSLDDALTYNLKQLEAAGKKSRVNFRALVKYSRGKNQEEHPGTRLFTMTEDKGLAEEQVHDANYRLDNPAHLTDFIKESKEKMPADKYILIIWNHGNVFGPADGPVLDSYPETESESRGAVFDDNIEGDPGLSTLGLEKAIKDTGEKIDLLYFDVCLMGMAETYTQLKDVTHYAMGAINMTPGQGGNYSRLVSCLQDNDSIEDAVKSYIPGLMTDWKASVPSFCDLSCFDLTYMDELNLHIKSATDELKRWQKDLQTPNTEKGIDEFEATQNYVKWYINVVKSFPENVVFAPRIDNEENTTAEMEAYSLENGGTACSTDLLTALKRCATLVDKPNGTLSGYTTLIGNTLRKMTLATGCINQPGTMDGVSMGVTWPYLLTLTMMDTAPEYLSNLEGSAFNKATGWVDFMKQIEMKEYAEWKDNTFDTGIKYYYWANEDELLQKQNYYWTVKLSSADTNLSQDASKEIENTENEVNEILESRPAPLFHGRGLVQSIYYYISGKYSSSRAFAHVTINLSLVDGQDESLNADEDNTKYPHTIEKSFPVY